ncbi:MAG: Holliday junction resolvase RuvX [Candidatus Omnitrophica bacterium]|nr:Holliday junction resolvase RuvX [Candidatus Omnitrophota bacterium]
MAEIILCLDVGTKRIGVAKSDALGVAAHAFPMIERKNDAQAVEAVLKLIQEEQVERIVVGLPINMNDTLGPASVMAKSFAGLIQQKTSVPVEFWDERLSTAEAERFLIGLDMSRAKRKTKIDSLAAQIILKSYMDARRK